MPTPPPKQIEPPSAPSKLSLELARVAALCRESHVTFGTLIQQLSPKDHSLFTVVLALPFLFPVPLPGLSQVFGGCIAISGVRMLMSKGPWLPKFLRGRHVPATLMAKIFGFGERLTKRMEFLIKPRGRFFHAHPFSIAVNGGMIAVCGILLALPLPPGTNFPPAIAILLLSVGSMEEDGLVIVLGWLAFALNVALFSLLPILGYSGIKALVERIF